MTAETGKKTNRKDLGIAVVGSGRIGTLRASLAAAHPAVSFVAVSDPELSHAKTLAEKTGAQLYSENSLEVISRPEVNAVIVSAPEPYHALPVIQALERGKPVLVEKPIALTLDEADKMIAASRSAKVGLHVGYSQRHHRRYLLAKDQIQKGALGQITGGVGRLYGTRKGILNILQRTREVTPVVDILTYYVDLFCWFMEGNRPVEVVARGQRGVIKAAGHDINDVTWAILTFADGAVVNLGIFSALPERYPGQSVRVEILGTDGVMFFDGDNKDQILYTDRGVTLGYVPNHTVNMTFLSCTPAGDWALGDFRGPLADETRAWLDHISTGRPCCLATPEQALVKL